MSRAFGKFHCRQIVSKLEYNTRSSDIHIVAIDMDKNQTSVAALAFLLSLILWGIWLFLFGLLFKIVRPDDSILGVTRPEFNATRRQIECKRTQRLD